MCYFAAGGGLSPVFFTSTEEVVVVSPPGVETVVFFVAVDLSAQPTVPTAITHIIRAMLRIRFIINSSC
jgi:hypothetical protein